MGEGKGGERGEQSGSKTTHGRVDMGMQKGWRGASAGNSPDICGGSDLGILGGVCVYVCVCVCVRVLGWVAERRGANSRRCWDIYV